MDLINVDIEDAGLEVLLLGMKHPALRDNSWLKALYAALTFEWASRETKESSVKQVGLPMVSTLKDQELKEAAGLFDGLCSVVDVRQYPRTFAFCFGMFRVLVEEINLRTPDEGATVH